MDLSGLIFVALALVWAVVLIPKALRAHDDAARTRSVADSSDDARVLNRPGRASATPAEGREPSLDRQALLARQRRLAGAAARRRRRVLTLLLLATAATAIASATGVLVPWAAGVPAGLVVGFLFLARVLVRREHAAWAATLRALRPAATTDADDVVDGTGTAADEPSPEPELVVVARNDQGVAVVSDVEDTSAFDAATLAAVGARPSSLWDPLPMTLPTYVSKPRATRSVRTIELGGPGVSSSGHDAADSALVAETATNAEEQEPPAPRAVGS